MTDMTGRCRRLHQDSCDGPTLKGLCAKHRADWEAMTADWDRRAEAAEAAARKPTKRPDANRPWTDDENTVLRTHTIAEATQLLKRSIKAIEHQRKRLGLVRTLWTPEQEQILRDHGDIEAARLIGKPVSAIRARRSNLRIPAPDAKTPWTAAEDRVLHRYGIQRAEATLLGRSRGDIITRRNELGINRANTTTTHKESA